MCGIVGFVDFSFSSDQSVLERMTNTLEHRGPDGAGCDVFDLPEARIGLGHKRLSILDLSELGRQPMYSEDESCSIIFNGEVYNFLEVRAWLTKQGYTFKSESDTEVILRALMVEGVDAVARFRGMFSIAFLDGRKKKLWLIRDRAGVKPLHYAELGDTLVFGSQLRVFHQHASFKKELDLTAVAQFLDFGYVRQDRCIFKSVKKLLPGHALELDLTSRKVNIKEYWSHAKLFEQPKLSLSYQEAVEELEKQLIEAFKLRMVSDVPVGVFMSGGIDSTTVAGILQKHYGSISTFTIGFDDEKYNEADKAKIIANHLGTDHHEMYCSEKELLDIFPKLSDIYDEPFSDKSAIPSVLVSQFARSNVTVALSADGGDEIFAGYNKYFDTLKVLNNLKGSNTRVTKKLIYGVVYHQLAGLLGHQSKLYLKASSELRYLSAFPDTVTMMIEGNRTFGTRDLKKLINTWDTDESLYQSLDFRSEMDELDKLQVYDYQDYLPDDILVKMDRASMSVSLESREPLLDHKIAEFAARLPSDYHYKNGISKSLLRSVNEKYIPQELTSIEKKGFAVPKKKWLDTHLQPFVDEYLDETHVRNMSFFDENYVRDLLKAFKNGRGHNRVWNLLIFSMWYERWMS